MIRKIIKINAEACNGCGLCVNACNEGAIGIVDGKAKLLRDDYCDGLGDCLPSCAANAISFEEREASSYNRELVMQRKLLKQSMIRAMPSKVKENNEKIVRSPKAQLGSIKKPQPTFNEQTSLTNWPVQIKLMSPIFPCFEKSDVLIAADCTAYSYANFHNDFMSGKTTLIGCPKLDNIDYSEKLSEVFSRNNVNSVTIVRMDVPCCRGIEFAVREGIRKSGKDIEPETIIISTKGKIIK